MHDDEVSSRPTSRKTPGPRVRGDDEPLGGPAIVAALPPTACTLMLTAAADRIARQWHDDIVPRLVEYVRIPAKSPHFDPQWQANGHIERVTRLAEAWVRAQPVKGLTA